MNTCNLKVDHLRAALLCAANKDIRYYLCGVLLQIRQRDVLAVATDGHRLCVIRRENAEDEPDNAPTELIVPREVLKGIKPATARATDCVLHYDAAQPLAECKLDGLKDGGRTFSPIDGKFPDWVRVAPEKLSGETCTFDPYFVADFADLVRILSGNARAFPNVYPNGNGSAAITCDSCPEFLGVLMPMRWDQPEYVRPDWLTIAPDAKLKRAA